MKLENLHGIDYRIYGKRECGFYADCSGGRYRRGAGGVTDTADGSYTSGIYPVVYTLRGSNYFGKTGIGKELGNCRGHYSMCDCMDDCRAGTYNWDVDRNGVI